MADSIREQIFAAVKTAVEGVAGVGEVSRGKIDPLGINRFPAAYIFPGFDGVTEYLGDRIDRDMQVFVALVVKTEVDIHKQLETMLPKFQQALAADHTLGGVSIDLSETGVSEPLPLVEDETIAAVVIETSVKYRVRRDDPYSHG